VAKPTKLTGTDLLAIIRAHREDSLGVEDGDLSDDRAKAMDHYHGRPYGNEQEGRSAIVSRDLAEAIDWAMPAIMRVFTQSGSLGEFDPVGPDDEDAATQESDYVNQVIMKDNPGFILLHDAIKDTLLLKNGYVKHNWDVATKITEDEYSGLTMDEIAQMVTKLEQSGAKVEVSAAEATQVTMQTPGGPMPIELWSLRLKVTRKKGKVCIEAVPTEEVRVSKRCRGTLQESPFTEHVTRKTRSDLIEMGMPHDFVDSLAAFNERDNSTQSFARDSVADESDTTDGGATGDRSMDEIEYCEAYLKVDWDGDGIAELRKVVTVSEKLPPGDEWNEPISAVPMTSFMAKRMPHRHVGESLDDELADLQEIKTVLLRQLLDNIYLTNNNQWLVNERVNIKDFMTSLPGGVKRVSGNEPVLGAAEPIMSTPIVGQILPVVDYMDNIKEGRTGISRSMTGLDPDTLKQSTKGAFLENLNRASQKMEMITRMLAETGVKELVLQVHALLMRHQDKPRVVQMRGKWVQINPQEWQDRTDMTAKVGLGTGNEEERRQKLLLVSSLQDKLAAAGLVDPKHAYAMFAELAETLGFDQPDRFALSPDSPEFQQKMANQKPPPNPMVEVEQVKGQIHLQGKQMDAQTQQQETAAKLQYEREKCEIEAQAAAQIEQIRHHYESIEAARKDDLERWKVETQEQTKIVLSEMSGAQAVKTASMSANASDQDNPMELDEHGQQRPRASLAALVETVNQSLEQVFATQSDLAQRHEMLAAEMREPKPVQVDYGPDGKIAAVNGRAIVRNRPMPQEGM
jgi:hypothetical protein